MNAFSRIKNFPGVRKDKVSNMYYYGFDLKAMDCYDSIMKKVRKTQDQESEEEYNM